MFRERQKYISLGVGLGRMSYPTINPQTGFVQRTKRTYARALPAAEMFDPTACVKAGKNLDLVNSKVFGFYEIPTQQNDESSPASAEPSSTSV